MTFRERANKIFESRAFYIVFSVVLSITLWVYVERVENEDIDSLGIAVNVEFLNPEIVADRRLIITSLGSERLTFKFSGKRSAISKLYDSGAVRVTADLADITSPGLNMLGYTISYAEGIDPKTVTVLSRSDNYIAVNVEKVFERQVPVTAIYSGDNVAAEGYQAEPAIFAPENVTVYGPQSEVDRVTAVRVDILRENLSKTVTAEMPYTPIDADGNAVAGDNLSFDRDTVSVTIPIRMVKDITLTATLIPGAGATMENTVVTVSPSVITLSGDTETLGIINSITIATIDLTKFESFYTVTVPIAIPNDVSNLTGTTEAEITVTIKGLEVKHMSASSSNLQIVNATAGLTATLITTSVDVAIRGPAELLDAITPESVRVVADLSEFGGTTGTFTVPARVYLDGSFGDCASVGDYKVTVRVIKDIDETT
ncbi:MAG: hypothetical protein LBN99_08435, partial [Oscillospiraceae bacterium]|nr:hypothetical protein [Oscillospiraceae bacterium]